MSFDQNPRDDQPIQATPETVGNQHGYLCPQCKSGERIRIACTVWGALYPEGTDTTDSDTEWGPNNKALCMEGNCDWAGKVSDLLTVELLKED